MKRVLAGRSNDNSKKYFTYDRNGRKYGVHLWNDTDPDTLRIQMTRITPYDDAEYTWAKYEGGLVKFIYDGRVKYTHPFHEYDEEYYETFDEYIGEVVDEMALNLNRYNADVEPRMVHN